MFSASTIKKWGGGSKEEAAIFLHGIEQDFGHKVQSIWEGNVLECAFAGDVNKLEIVKSCSKAAQTIIETYKDEKRNKRPFSVSSSQVNIFDVAKTVLQKKIRMIDNNMNDRDGLPLVADESGRARIDVTPRREKVRRTTALTRNEKETIRRNLQKQLDEEEYTQEILVEAKEFQKGLQEFNAEWREGETGTEAKRDKELLKCFRVCASRLITEAGTGRVPTDMADYKVHLSNLHSNAVPNSRGQAIDPMLVSVNQESQEVLEGTRRKMGASIVSESNAREVSALLGFVRGVKVRLQPFFWLCNLFKKKEEVLVIKEDVHASLAEVVERVYRQGGREATVEQANSDGRVASGAATRYEVFEQGLEKNSRYLNEGVVESKTFKGVHKIEGIGAGAPGEESAEPQGQVLALSLSKDPCAKAILEKLTKFDARLTETFFQNSKEVEKAKSKTAEEEAEKKKEDEEKKEKKKSKKRKAREKEESDSEGSDSGKKLVALLKENNKQILEVVKGELSKVAGAVGIPVSQGLDNQRCYNFERTGFCRFGDKCKFVSSHTGQSAQGGYASPMKQNMGGNNYQNSRHSFSPQQQNQNQNFRGQNFQGGGNPQFQNAQFQGGGGAQFQGGGGAQFHGGGGAQFQGGGGAQFQGGGGGGPLRFQKGQGTFPECKREQFCEALWKTGKCVLASCSGPHGKWDETAQLQCRFEENGEKCPFQMGLRGCRRLHKFCKKI